MLSLLKYARFCYFYDRLVNRVKKIQLLVGNHSKRMDLILLTVPDVALNKTSSDGFRLVLKNTCEFMPSRVRHHLVLTELQLSTNRSSHANRIFFAGKTTWIATSTFYVTVVSSGSQYKTISRKATTDREHGAISTTCCLHRVECAER